MTETSNNSGNDDSNRTSTADEGFTDPLRILAAGLYLGDHDVEEVGPQADYYEVKFRTSKAAWKHFEDKADELGARGPVALLTDLMTATRDPDFPGHQARIDLDIKPTSPTEEKLDVIREEIDEELEELKDRDAEIWDDREVAWKAIERWAEKSGVN